MAASRTRILPLSYWSPGPICLHAIWQKNVRFCLHQDWSFNLKPFRNEVKIFNWLHSALLLIADCFLCVALNFGCVSIDPNRQVPDIQDLFPGSRSGLEKKDGDEIVPKRDGLWIFIDPKRHHQHHRNSSLQGHHGHLLT
jgi:hypothetical protein